MAETVKAAIPYGGAEVSIAPQVDLVTFNSGGLKELRYISIDSYTTSGKLRKPQSNLGHRNDADFTAKGILYEAGVEDGFQITLPIVRGTDSATDPPLVTILESGGWSAVENTATTIALYTDAGNWTLTDDVFGADCENVYILVTLDSGELYPCLLRSYTSATKTCVAATNLPSAASGSNVVERMYTLTPRVGPIAASKLLSIRVRTRAGSYDYTGCALSKLGDIEMLPNGEWAVQCTFHLGDVAVGATAMSAESFQGGLIEQLVQGSYMAIGDTHATDPISHANLVVNKMKITNPYQAIMRRGWGADSTVLLNDVRGYVVKRPPQSADDSMCQAEITSTFDTDLRTDFTSQQAKVIQVVRGSSALTTPALGIALPDAFPLQYPADNLEGDESDETILMTQGFGGRSPRYEGTDPDEAGNRDIVIGISGDAP